jgi:hypothetical protein
VCTACTVSMNIATSVIKQNSSNKMMGMLRKAGKAAKPLCMAWSPHLPELSTARSMATYKEGGSTVPRVGDCRETKPPLQGLVTFGEPLWGSGVQGQPSPRAPQRLEPQEMINGEKTLSPLCLIGWSCTEGPTGPHTSQGHTH